MFLGMLLCFFAGISTDSLGGKPEIIRFMMFERDRTSFKVCVCWKWNPRKCKITFSSFRLLWENYFCVGTSEYPPPIIFLFQVCGPGAEDREACETRAFPTSHSVLQWHRRLHHHLSSQRAHRGGRLTQWPLLTLWCYHWVARCVQGECWRVFWHYLRTLLKWMLSFCIIFILLI